MATATEALNIMRGWVGLSRQNQTHREIIDIYNSYSPKARGYAVTYWDDYCDATISACFIALSSVDEIGGTECGVHEHVQKFKAAGIWTAGANITPAPGWVVVFDWDLDGIADHIGMVESVSGTQIITIEGNISGGVVGRREMFVGYPYIMGYAKPKYQAQPAPAPDPGWKAKGTAICTEDYVNIRQTPAGKVLGYLMAGQRFEIDGKTEDGWTHANVSGVGVCWIFSEYVQKDKPWKSTGTAVCIADGVNVRTTPTEKTDDNIIGILNAGQRFEVDGKKSGGWIHANVAGMPCPGWIYKSWIRYD